MDDQDELNSVKTRKTSSWVVLISLIFAIATFYGGGQLWVKYVEHRKTHETISHQDEKFLFDSINKYNHGYRNLNGEYVFTYSPEQRKQILNELASRGIKISYQNNGDFLMTVYCEDSRIEIIGGTNKPIRSSYFPIEPW